MLRIGNTIFSDDILEKKFKCNLQKCLGNCCRYGDSGAPLSAEEADIIDDIFPVIKPFLRSEGIDAIGEQGTSTRDFENDIVTPLVGNAECAYAIIKDNIFMCGIEKAFLDGRISFQKPVSCHLFPARIKKFRGFAAVNYQELSICYSALECGGDDGVYVYEFLKAPFIRVLGEETYRELCIAAEELRRRK
ncbi:MAG: DUF3109 family protein [Bacteroidota bacterium]|nr:DUF3109 family protein [Bacteroidota bacterium]